MDDSTNGSNQKIWLIMNKQAIMAEIVFTLLGLYDLKSWIKLRARRECSITIKRDQIYTIECDLETLKADIYCPKNHEKQAAVLLIHGGGWCEPECRALMHPIAKQLARSGYVVMNISYRLAPKYQHPAPIEDIDRALNWLRIHRNELGINPDRIAAFGYSAGGHLAALQATLQTTQNKRLMAAVVGGAPTELAKYPKGKLVSRYLGGAYDETPERYVEASPIHHVHQDMTPIFLYHGTNDTLVPVDHATDFKIRLDQAEVINELLLLKNQNHITTFFSQKALLRAIVFLDNILLNSKAV